MDQIKAWEGEPLLEQQVRELKLLNEQEREREVILSVIGQFKRGKSSLINAMLGKPLLPVGILPLTSAVTELRSGPEEKFEVCFLDGGRKEISAGEVSAYCSEQENGGNRKGVALLRIETPAHPFGPGVVLVDTPGVGSVYKDNTDTTMDYLKRSDGVLFLLSVDSPVSEIEREFLLSAREYASRFFFAVNKADGVSPGDRKDFLEFCARIIRESLGEEKPIRAVSARTGEGIAELVAELKTTLEECHDSLLARSLTRKRARVVEQGNAKIRLAMQAASLPAEELEAKLNRAGGLRREVSDFSRELEVLARRRTELLVEEVGQHMNLYGKELTRKLPEIYDRMAEQMDRCAVPGWKERMRKELDGFLAQALARLDGKGLEELTEGYEAVARLLEERTAAAERRLSDWVREEFGLAYPVSEQTFRVAEENDFIIKIGIRGLPAFDGELRDRLLPRRAALARLREESLSRAAEDVECNVNNMLYNYRYKMQESLRPLCRELGARVERLGEELDGLLKHFSLHLHDAQTRRQEEKDRWEQLLVPEEEREKPDA